MRRALLTGAAVLVAVAATAAATGCAGEKSDADVSSDGGGSGKSNVPQVTFRYQSGASYGAVSPFELAQKLGYYDGTSVRIHSVGVSKSGPEDIQAIAAGSNDIASTNTAPIINANKSGLHIKAVVAYGTTVTKDLYGEEVSIGAIARLLCELRNVPFAPKYVEARPGDIRRLGADASKARRLLGELAPTPIREGLRRYLEWLDQQHLDFSELAPSLEEQNWRRAPALPRRT